MHKICLFLVFLTIGILYGCNNSSDERFQYQAIREVPELLQQKARNRLDVYHVRHFANDSTLAFTEAQKEKLLLLMANKVYAAEEAKTFIKDNKEMRDSLRALRIFYEEAFRAHFTSSQQAFVDAKKK